ncbi:unnamed protein product [Chondrus crispus]|uniref:Uncharacterized protein n=1 Tax=Chondrus crispus TaxID=2769 RepID=R7QHS3_CHOCR|nr:unnamed protein product [Chondrus crispus]CDF37629.1 unnamed protein product [Chondrus crispus]|eukprot:XP_005717500.1 unnamed protein product [Chondrus crispus]
MAFSHRGIRWHTYQTPAVYSNCRLHFPFNLFVAPTFPTKPTSSPHHEQEGEEPAALLLRRGVRALRPDGPADEAAGGRDGHDAAQVRGVVQRRQPAPAAAPGQGRRVQRRPVLLLQDQARLDLRCHHLPQLQGLGPRQAARALPLPARGGGRGHGPVQGRLRSHQEHRLRRYSQENGGRQETRRR